MNASESNTNTSSFQEALNMVIESAATDHPYHTLYQLYALSNGDRLQLVQSSSRTKDNDSPFVVDQDKIKAASSMHHKKMS